MIEEMRIRRYTPHTEEECRNVAKRIIELQQENQQLKEQLELNDCKTIYNQFVNYKNWYFEYVDKCENYKSVLDEIDKKINDFIKCCKAEKIESGSDFLHYSYWNMFENFNKQIKEILDKVKE